MAERKFGGIPEPPPPTVDTLPLRFSFKHLDWSRPKFNPMDCCPQYLRALLQTLHRFSTWTVGEFTDMNNKENRHLIWFPETTEPNGFRDIPNVDAEQFGFNEGWQFRVEPPEPWMRWRAHGILIDDTFYIVWLDQYHCLYP
jgi:hypothetical protein